MDVLPRPQPSAECFPGRAQIVQLGDIEILPGVKQVTTTENKQNSPKILKTLRIQVKLSQNSYSFEPKDWIFMYPLDGWELRGQRIRDTWQSKSRTK